MHGTIHGHDVANYSTPLTHRVVTVSAADLLSPSPPPASSPPPTLPTAETPARPPVGPLSPSSRCIPTGLETLDAILAGTPLPATTTTTTEQPAAAARLAGGVRRGQVTEIWGPPGSGKSTFGMQLAANALRDGLTVAWIDCFQPLCEERLATLVAHQLRGQQEDTADTDTVADRFTRYTCPSLAHFIAMLCPPPPARPACVPDAAALLVIDSVSALVNYALPRSADNSAGPLMANGRRGPSAHDKRTQVLQFVTAALERVAETRRMAVVVLTQCATRVQAGLGGSGGGSAGLAPSLSADVWNRGIAARVVLFRDWAWDERAGRPVGGRFAGVQKNQGNDSDTGMDAVVAFDIAADAGLVEVQHYTPISPGGRRGRRFVRTLEKRKLGDADLSGDSDDDDDDDDYGWDDELTNSLPRMPPQWQGSEDILLGPGEGEEEEEEEEDDEVQIVDVVDKAIPHVPRRRSQSVADSEAESDCSV